MDGNRPEEEQDTDTILVEHKFDEAKFFLGEMEKANLAFSRNVRSIQAGHFVYYLSAFCGAVYSIDVFLREKEEYHGLKEWLDTEAHEKLHERHKESYETYEAMYKAHKEMYELFLARDEEKRKEMGIRHDFVHMERVFEKETETSPEDIQTGRTEKMGDHRGVNYVFAEKERGEKDLEDTVAEDGDEYWVAGVLEENLVEEYREEEGGRRVYARVIDVAEDFLYEFIYRCLEDQTEFRAGGDDLDTEEMIQ